MTTYTLVCLVALIAVWSTFEGAERDLWALLSEEPPRTRVAVALSVWISARVVAALTLAVAWVGWVISGGAA